METQTHVFAKSIYAAVCASPAWESEAQVAYECVSLSLNDRDAFECAMWDTRYAAAAHVYVIVKAIETRFGVPVSADAAKCLVTALVRKTPETPIFNGVVDRGDVGAVVTDLLIKQEPRNGDAEPSPWRSTDNDNDASEDEDDEDCESMNDDTDEEQDDADEADMEFGAATATHSQSTNVQALVSAGFSYFTSDEHARLTFDV